ncbi:Echinoderm microtubule-associated protein-like 5 [Phlyctochytrium planicorne]|nr:Echinoderm microtubule-associated protein-like 5 [Phlyctochytrium planicorne]
MEMLGQYTRMARLMCDHVAHDDELDSGAHASTHRHEMVIHQERRVSERLPNNAVDEQANRPWAGAVVAPTNATAPAKDAQAKANLVLEYVHGFRMRDVNNTAFYITPNTIAFPAGSMGVVLNVSANTQTFFQNHHKDDVTAIAVHPSKKYVATGDIVSHSAGTYIFVWDAANPAAAPVAKIHAGDKPARGVADLEFSSDGKYLVAVLMDNDHTVQVYEWQKAGAKPLSADKGSTDDIFGITFNPKNNNEFVTYGVKHLKYWTINATTGRLENDRAIFGSHRTQSVLSLAFLPDGTFVTGTFNGDLLFWNKNNITKAVEKVHEGPIFSVIAAPFGLITSSKDGSIHVHELASLKVLQKYKLDSGVRSADLSSDGSLLVGLENSTLLEIKNVAKGGNPALLLEGHSALKLEELWGAATDPHNDNEFVTAGDDSAVFKRTVKEKKTIAKAKLNGKLRSIAYSADSKLLAVGNDSGDMFLLKSSDLSTVATKKYEVREGIKSKIHAVEVLKFSPNGKYLAVGTHDDVIYIWEVVGSDLKYTGLLKGHSSFVTHLDWSADSTHIQSNSGDYELLYWAIPSLQQVTSATSVKDVEWATFSCIFGWPVQGIWEKGMDGTDINTLDRNPAKTISASGDDFFNVRLHVYPAVHEEMPVKKFTGHGSHVTKTLFTAKGTHLISLGGMDGCAFQWRVDNA